MSKEVDFFHLDSEDAKLVAFETRKRLHINVRPLNLDCSPINPQKPFIIYNGDGYLHHLTRRIVKELSSKRRTIQLPPFSYLHIDGHDDLDSINGDNNTFRSFVQGIMGDQSCDGVYFLEEGLTGKRRNNPTLLTPKIELNRLDWSEDPEGVKQDEVYVSVDFDVLDKGAGIHHLFPQSPIGFDIYRLLWNLETLGQRYKFIGVDLVGFSTKGTSREYLEMSLDNIALVTRSLCKVLTAS